MPSCRLAPAKSRGDGRQNRLHGMPVVFNTQLVGDGQQQCVGLRNRLVVLELLDQDIRLGGIGTAEDRARRFVKIANLVDVLPSSASEIKTIAVVDQREDTAADGNTRGARVAGFLP